MNDTLSLLVALPYGRLDTPQQPVLASLFNKYKTTHETRTSEMF